MHHAGQVSLPGGVLEPGESSAEACLRELSEELGLAADEISLLGRLSPLYVFGSGFMVTPWVGWIAVRPELAPNVEEVAQVVEVAVSQLLDETYRGWATVEARGTSVSVPCFRLGGHNVWGATSMILAELAEVLRDISTLGD